MTDLPAPLDPAYDNRAHVPDHPAIFARWAQEAADYRAGARSELGVPYGPGARHRIDLFLPEEDRGLPLVSFIHGGYWRALDPSLFSHMARGLVARGFVVAVPGYDLCPQATIAGIIEAMRAAHALLWRRFRRRIVASGHSAGGHLAACLLATDWRARGADLPDALVPAAYAISGLFDLTPLLRTSMNADLRLDAASARAASPLLWPAPRGLALDAVAGAAELPAFPDQSRAIAREWGAHGVATRFGTVPGANHFTILDPLARPDSAPVARIEALARAVRPA